MRPAGKILSSYPQSSLSSVVISSVVIRRKRLHVHCPSDTNPSISLGHRPRLKKGSGAPPGALPLLSIPLLVTDYACTWFRGTQRLHVSVQEAQETVRSYSRNLRREFCPTSEGASSESLKYRACLVQHISIPWHTSTLKLKSGLSCAKH